MRFEKSQLRKKFHTWVILALALVLCAWFLPVQSIAKDKTISTLQTTLVAFAAARTINGVLSVAKDSELNLTLGPGVTVAAGKIVQPVHQMIDLLCDLLLITAAALVFQAILADLGSVLAIKVLLTIFTALALLAWNFQIPHRRLIYNGLAILVLIRFAIPGAVIATHYLSDSLFGNMKGDQIAIVKMAAHELSPESEQESLVAKDSMGSASASSARGFWEKLKGFPASVGQTITSITATLKSPIDSVVDWYERNAKPLPEAIIRLITVFLIEAILLPLALFFAIYIVGRSVIRALQSNGASISSANGT